MTDPNTPIRPFFSDYSYAAAETRYQQLDAYKEEAKTKWDLRRWRVQHEGGRDYFWGEYKDKNTFSNSSRYRFRGLYPFFSTQSGKYFFDARFQWVGLNTFEYNPIDYYFGIPGGEVAKSPVIDQQPNR